MGAVLFMISFASMPVSSQDTETTKTIKGSILAIDADSAMVEIKDESGERMSLKAGSEVSLDPFSEGQHVTIECSDEGMITNMNKEN